MVKISNKHMVIGIAIAIVVAILAVIGVCVGMQIQADQKYPSVTEEEFVGSYYCESPGGRDVSCTLTINSDYTFSIPRYSISGTWSKYKDGKWLFEGLSKEGADITFTIDPSNHKLLEMFFKSTEGYETWYFKKTNQK